MNPFKWSCMRRYAVSVHLLSFRTVADVMLAGKMHAIPFYEKCGYRPEGEPFDEDGGE